MIQTLIYYYFTDNQDEPVQPKYDVNAPDLCKIHNFVLYYFAFFVRWIFFIFQIFQLWHMLPTFFWLVTFLVSEMLSVQIP